MFKRSVLLVGAMMLIAVAGCANSRESCSHAASKAATTIAVAGGELGFESSTASDFPLKVVKYHEKDCKKSFVDKYEWAGGTPQIVAAFSHPLKGKMTVWVIVSWSIDHSGAGVKGTLYQVYAYNQNPQGQLARSRLVDGLDEMTGIEGISDHEQSHFYGKTPAELKQLIVKLGLQ